MVPETVDVLVHGCQVVTMNASRDIIRDGAVAVRGSTIVGVGKTADLAARYTAARTHRRRPVRGDARDGQHAHPHHRRAADARLRPRRHAVRRERVRVAVPAVRGAPSRTRSGPRRSSPRSRCCARARRRSSRPARSATSTTSSTVSSRSGSAAVSGAGSGTSRRSRRCTGRRTDAAIAHLEQQLHDHRSHADDRIAAWSILVGHNTCSDPLWQAAKRLARRARRRA